MQCMWIGGLKAALVRACAVHVIAASMPCLLPSLALLLLWQ